MGREHAPDAPGRQLNRGSAVCRGAVAAPAGSGTVPPVFFCASRFGMPVGTSYEHPAAPIDDEQRPPAVPAQIEQEDETHRENRCRGGQVEKRVGLYPPGSPVMAPGEVERRQGSHKDRDRPPVVVLEKDETQAEIMEEEQDADGDDRDASQPAVLGAPFAPGCIGPGVYGRYPVVQSPILPVSGAACNSVVKVGAGA